MIIVDKLYKVKLKKILTKINAKQDEFRNFSVDDFRAKTEEFKNRIKNGEQLDDLLVEAYALVCVAACKTLGYKEVFDSQILAAIAKNDGKIVELATGEGKTLVATLPAYLYALSGDPVHIMTSNDYLAERDSKDMGRLFSALGLSVGLVSSKEPSKDEKRRAYASDIVYGQASEFAFDFLRDNTRTLGEQPVCGKRGYAVVDEVDSIMIDQAITPIVMSKNADTETKKYEVAAQIVKKLILPQKNIFVNVDPRIGFVALTNSGITRLEQAIKSKQSLEGLDLFDGKHNDFLFYINNALKAEFLMQKGRDYIVESGKVILVDQNTGRPRPTHKFSDGLHSAIEMKEKLNGENVEISMESTTVAQTTYQGFFELYDKVSGMSGTAVAAADEFSEIYGLDVVAIAPHIPSIRKDEEESVFQTEKQKFGAMVVEVDRCHAQKRPVLVVTESVEESKRFSKLLNSCGIRCKTLNAENEANEASIIAEAGRLGAVTVATNMAGRGTDIKLGGSDGSQKEQVQKLGGLRVLGASKQKSARIDGQIIGRAGRQGEEGSTKFFVSLEDAIVNKCEDDEKLEIHRLKTSKNWSIDQQEKAKRIIDRAQKRCDGIDYATRKGVSQFSRVLNAHMMHFYNEREKVFDAKCAEDLVSQILDVVDDDFVLNYAQTMNTDTSKVLRHNLQAFDQITGQVKKNMMISSREMIKKEILSLVDKAKDEDSFEIKIRQTILKEMDENWKSHIDFMNVIAKKQAILKGISGEDLYTYYRTEGNKQYCEMLEKTSKAILLEVVKMCSQELERQDDTKRPQ